MRNAPELLSRLQEVGRCMALSSPSAAQEVRAGHAKSLLTAVFWVAWRWIDHPEARWLFSSYREPLATRDSVKCRRLIESTWYQKRWGDRYQLSDDQNQKSRFENSRTGNRVVVPMSAGTGERGDYAVSYTH